VNTERETAEKVQRMGAREPDPLVREAIALQGYEESRHAALLDRLTERYGITVQRRTQSLDGVNPSWDFIRTEYGECFDAFFAFGLFALAERAGFFPTALVQVFEPVIQEEARHNLFFVNWVAYTRANLAIARRPRFLAERLAALAVQILKRLSTAKEIDGDNFTRKGGSAIGIDIAPRPFLELCLAENERRLSRYDPRLLRPRIMPAAAHLAMRLLRRDAAAR